MNILSQFINNIRARIAKHYVTKNIVATLSLAHAQELGRTPGEMWPQVKERQGKEILAVRAGNLDIVDRRSWAFPYLPSTLTRLQQPIIKMIPYNLRRFAKTPVPRRAINLIKNAVTSLDWDIVPIKNVEASSTEDQSTRIQIGKKCFQHPNNEQSFQGLLETGIDDFCIMGGLVLEPQITPDPNRPLKMWNVDCSTIRFFPNWRESDPDQPHYAQMTGLKGERGIIVFYDDELIYIKDNPSVETPFGTSKMEVAFQSITAFLGVQEMSGRAGADQVHKTWLWWEQAVGNQNVDIIRRHVQNDLEGQAKINLVTGFKKPDVIDVQTVSPDDLLLDWQEMLIRMIAAAFDMSAQAFLERDINRSTGEVLSDMDFRSAVVPTAVRIAEYFTRKILHQKLGWTDLEFKFLNLDDPDLQTKVDMLAKQYSMNAVTPNEIRAELGKPPLTTKMADLTQFEAILVNTQASAQIQDSNAAKASDRSAQQQQQQFEQYSQMQQPQGGQEQQEQQAAAMAIAPPVGPKASKSPAKLKLISPKMPKLPLMPMAGSRYNAYQVAAMSVAELAAAMASGSVPNKVSTLQQSMQTQDPSILEQMEPGVAAYLEQLKKQQQAEDAKLKPKVTPQATKEQLKKFRKSKHIPALIERTVYRTSLKPGTKTKETRALVSTFGDQRRRNKPDNVGGGTGKEIAQTDVNKSKVKRRNGGS